VKLALFLGRASSMSSRLASVFCFSKRIRNTWVNRSWDYILALLSDGSCLSLEIVRDHNGSTSFRVGDGSYQRQAVNEDASLDQIVITWAEDWTSRNSRTWKQTKKPDELHAVTMDLEKGGPYTTQPGASIAPAQVEHLEVATLDVLVKKVPGGVFPKLPPSLLSQLVLTLTTETLAGPKLRVICTKMGGSQCASLEVLPQPPQTLGMFRSSIAKEVGIDVAQVQLILTSGKLLDRVLDDSLLYELLECGKGEVAEPTIKLESGH